MTPAAIPGTESPIVTAILQCLHAKGVWAWRVNSSLQVIAAQASSARRVIKGAPAGSPDIQLVLPVRTLAQPIGMLCGIEVKTLTGKQSATQKAWQAKAERHGVRYGVARSITEALVLVEQWRRGS